MADAAGGARRILFAGGTGYIGSAAVAAARAAGHRPVVLTRSPGKARALEADGIEAVLGDLEGPAALDPKDGFDDAVFLAAPPSWGKRVSVAVARSFGEGLLRMTGAFLDLAARARVGRIVYIAGTSYYGDAGDGPPRSEDQPGPPKGWGPYLRPAVEVVEARVAAGAPAVLAFPGQVYGPASWAEQLYLRPLLAGKAIIGLAGYDPMFSPIHIDDCGRAIVHLLAHGAPGQRFILVDERPVRAADFVAEVARAMERSLRVRKVPRWLCSLLLGPVLTEYATAHTNFSSARLRATGFSFRFPDLRQGVPDVVRRWLAQQRRG